MNIESEFSSRFAEYGGMSRSQDENGSINGNATFVQTNPPKNFKNQMNLSRIKLKSNHKIFVLFVLIGGVAFVLYNREKKNKTKGVTKHIPSIQSPKQEESDEDPLFQKFTSVVNSKKKSTIE